MLSRILPRLSCVSAIVAGCSSPSEPAGGSSGSSGGASLSGDSSGSPTSASITVTDGTSVGDSSGTSPGTSSSSGADGSTTAGPDVGVRENPCTDSPTAFCELFDDYAETALADGQTFGPWRAALSDGGATMDLDGTHTVSGAAALHVRLEQGPTSGGRLFTNGDVPLLADTPSHVYGRMMMYIAENGTSVHWTFFGVQGGAEPSSPLAGNYAAYIMSSLPRDGVNTYSFVDGLSGGPNYQDCWAQGETPMPTGQWTCVSFEMDSLARALRMYVDGDAEPIVSVDDTGQGCVAPTPGDSLWYGPLVDELFVGSWSFHEMDAPLEVWIDDLVVDTVPVACP